MNVSSRSESGLQKRGRVRYCQWLTILNGRVVDSLVTFSLLERTVHLNLSGQTWRIEEHLAAAPAKSGTGQQQRSHDRRTLLSMISRLDTICIRTPLAFGQAGKDTVLNVSLDHRKRKKTRD